MDFYFGQKWLFTVKSILMMDLFFANNQLFTSQDINWRTGVVWITCDVFISCLNSHSDGTHSLQMIHWWASDAMLHCPNMMKKRIHLYHGLPQVESILCRFSFLGELFFFYSVYHGLISGLMASVHPWSSETNRWTLWMFCDLPLGNHVNYNTESML